MNPILEIIAQHKAGKDIGITSVCSAHPLVIEAALRHGKKNNQLVLIEATSNQVNQYGGYTGMQPEDFRNLVCSLAETIQLPMENLMLGGDHLGPNCWKKLSASDAMEKSDVLIERYVTTGFRKIHIDCSMPCADDPRVLNDEIVAKRAARLCAVAEKAWAKTGGMAPVYIVGTEVPVPGGAQEDLTELAPTSPEAAAATIKAHQQAFSELKLTDAWSRVVGLVVQPGVEFDHYKVVDFIESKAKALAKCIINQPHMVYEAHSTDYQSDISLRALVKNHFAILKVGPGLTFAMREALWALSSIEVEYIPTEKQSNLKSTLINVMKENPEYWESYYHAIQNTLSEQQWKRDCQYSLSDRIRYYWPQTKVTEALDRLFHNLILSPPPLSLVSQYLPIQYNAIRRGELSMQPKEIVMHKIEEVLHSYSHACKEDDNNLNKEEFLSYSSKILKAKNAYWTAKEISQQPETWGKTSDLLIKNAYEIRTFLQPILNIKNIRVLFTGAGTSAFIGECIAPYLTEKLNIRVDSVATTDLISEPTQYLNKQTPTLLVSFARSGNSPESVAAMNLADKLIDNCHQLVITCNKDGETYDWAMRNKKSFAILLPEETHDKSFAMTSSFSSMLLAALYLFTDSERSVTTKKIAKSTEKLIESYNKTLQQLAEKNYSKVIFLGSNGLKGISQEASLKLLELTDGKITTNFNSPLGFRHGPKSIVNNDTLIFIFISNNLYTRQYDLDLMKELLNDNIAGNIIAITAKPITNLNTQEKNQLLNRTILIEDLQNSDDAILFFPYVTCAQIYAFHHSLRTQNRPDTPSSSGTVNRVVKGVTIYPLN